MTTLGTTAFQDAIREGRTALLPGCFPTASRAAKVLRFLRRVPRSPTHQGWDHNLKPQLLGLRGAFEGAVLTLAYFGGGGGIKLKAKKRYHQGQPAGGARVRAEKHVSWIRRRPISMSFKSKLGVAVGKCMGAGVSLGSGERLDGVTVTVPRRIPNVTNPGNLPHVRGQ